MPQKKPDQPKPGTKLATLALSLEKGASLDQLGKSLGWQKHTVRAALTRLRQRGYRIDRSQPNEAGNAVYSLKPTRAKTR